MAVRKRLDLADGDSRANRRAGAIAASAPRLAGGVCPLGNLSASRVSTVISIAAKLDNEAVLRAELKLN